MQNTLSPKPQNQIPRWKMTLAIWLMVYPLLTVLTLVLNPVLKNRPILVRNLVTSIIFVPVMVYGVVPTAQRTVRRLESKQK